MSPPSPDSRVAWVALGANVGHRPAALRGLRASLGSEGVRLTGSSPEVVTRPIGEVRQRDFLNQVVRLDADDALPPREWLRRCQAAEHATGRRTTYRWGPRRADADLLMLGEDGALQWSDDRLTVPHSGLEERPFLHPLLRAAGYTGSRSASWGTTRRAACT